MRILYSPQRSEQEIEYTFNGEVITATLNGVTDTFDFTGTPDGTMESVGTILPINPIIEAWRDGGVLYVNLLKFHGPFAAYDERFPDWMEV
jgi:hypothetical protein